MIHPITDCEHPLLYFPGTGIASQEIAISGFCQQNLSGIVSGLVVVYGMDPWVGQSLDGPSSVSAPNFVSVTSSMGILFPILRKHKVSTLWSCIFLGFMCFANWVSKFWS